MEPLLPAPPPDVLVLVRDLIFSTKITSTARALARPVRSFREARALSADVEASLLIVDLNLDGAVEAAAAWMKGGAGRRAVGFISHVDAETISRARAAGLSEVMARSRFVEVLPALLAAEKA